MEEQSKTDLFLKFPGVSQLVSPDAQAGFGASRPYTVTDTLCDRHFQKTVDRLKQEIDPGPHRETFDSFLKRLADAKPDPKAV